MFVISRVALLLATVLPATSLTLVGNVTASPSASQLAWEQFEVGVMITFNLQTFCINPSSPYASKQRCQESEYSVPNWDFVTQIDLPDLDTDSWMDAAESFGARYAVLVVDHMTGFALWPTKQHNLSIAATRYKAGKGDVFSEYLASCASRSIAPGFFYSTHYNWFLGGELSIAPMTSPQRR
jgi:alpha-L-fucosidase